MQNRAMLQVGRGGAAVRTRVQTQYYYLESNSVSIPGEVCSLRNAVSPLREGETTEVPRMASEDGCEHDVFVQIL
jgi:hypothetical protein